MAKLSKKQYLQIGNILAVIGTIVVNLLANVIPIGGNTTGDLAEDYPNLFVPAGYVFSIWFIIYVLIVIFAVYQAKDLFKSEKEDLPFIEKISVFFIIGSLGNITWIFFWHYKVLIGALIAILILFLSLLIIYWNLEIGISDAPRNEKLYVHLPISVYFGWLTVATVAQIVALLVDLGVPSFGILADFLTVVVIIVVLLLALINLYTREDIAYNLVIVWASIGIFVKQLPSNLLISITALIAALIVGIFIIYLVYKKYIKK
ncbi:MAG: conserved membrane protein of unknown function [Promethearchaeota archaeon]|nr:MAG: conserved membrane protein of unknown function [Candidatus Lokiarchaeota archaeon]